MGTRLMTCELPEHSCVCVGGGEGGGAIYKIELCAC